MALVKDYGLLTDDNSNFKVNFWIPNNCDYGLQLLDEIYIISIWLHKGQTTPSPVFINCGVDVLAIANKVTVNFEQKLNGITATRPKMRVEDCGA
jgi:hypothetical protein